MISNREGIIKRIISMYSNTLDLLESKLDVINDYPVTLFFNKPKMRKDVPLVLEMNEGNKTYLLVATGEEEDWYNDTDETIIKYRHYDLITCKKELVPVINDILLHKRGICIRNDFSDFRVGEEGCILCSCNRVYNKAEVLGSNREWKLSEVLYELTVSGVSYYGDYDSSEGFCNGSYNRIQFKVIGTMGKTHYYY